MRQYQFKSEEWPDKLVRLYKLIRDSVTTYKTEALTHTSRYLRRTPAVKIEKVSRAVGSDSDRQFFVSGQMDGEALRTGWRPEKVVLIS